MKIIIAQKLHITLFLLLNSFLLLFVGCNNDSKPGTASSIDSLKKDTAIKNPADIQAALIDTKLSALYLENFPGAGHNQLHQLLNGHNGRGEKLVFQFFHKKTEKLTLRGWPTKRGNTEFDETEVQELKTLPGTNHVYNSYDIAGKDAYLGDQQIPKDVSSSLLIPIINSVLHPHPEAKYIVFEPDLSSNNHVYYNLYITADINFADSAAIAKVPLHVKTDPSPPARSN